MSREGRAKLTLSSFKNSTQPIRGNQNSSLQQQSPLIREIPMPRDNITDIIHKVRSVYDLDDRQIQNAEAFARKLLA